MNKKGFKARPLAFWPAAILLLVSVAICIVNEDAFYKATSAANDWLMEVFGGVFSIVGFLTVLGCVIAYFSPLGKVRIGGKNAKPLFSNVKSFYITLCTTIAAGVVFWGTVEPMYHLSSPPASLGIEPFSAEAIRFTMETMFLHWTITPYAIYTLPTLVFAFAFYNMKKPFSISSQFAPVAKKYSTNSIFTQIVDGICLLCIAAGMAAVFSTGTLNMSGAVGSIFGVSSTSFGTWVVILGAAIVVFLISSASGLKKGIKTLSSVNMYVYWVILAIVLLFGPFSYVLNLGTEALGGYIGGFFQKSFMTGAAANDMWPQWWTTFYWANWMAWAPVAACFLGRVAYGHTVKEVVTYTLIWPAIFGVVWMTLFSGAAIYLQVNGIVDLVGLLNSGNSQAIPYAVLEYFPLAKIIIPFFFFITFISFVTAADSTTNAMASLSSEGITQEDEEAPFWIKAVWGIGIGVISLVMLKAAGINGIKMLSNLGGAPATIFEALAFISVVMIAKNPKKYSALEEDRVEDSVEEVALGAIPAPAPTPAE